MSTIPTKSFANIVGTIAASMQSRINNRFLNFAIGTILRGLAEAYAGLCLFLQYQIITVAKLARLQTCFGVDVDSWMLDWPMSGITRFGATAASGLVTISRATPTAAVLYVPVGGLVKSSDGTLTFQVYADTTNPSFVPSYVPPGTSPVTPLGGYVVPAQVPGVAVPVVCITLSPNSTPNNQFSGANGNAAPGIVSLIASNMNGLDTCSNAAAFTNGSDTETDVSLKMRWQAAVQARGGGTIAAITSAILNLKNGMQSTVNVGINPDYSQALGTVTVWIDDGTGATPASVVAAANVALNDNVIGIRAGGIQVGAYAATTVYANVVMTITTLPGYIHATVVAQVVAAITLYINSLGIGKTLKYFPLSTAAQAVPGVDEIQFYTLNGGTSDIVGTPSTTIKAANPVIS